METIYLATNLIDGSRYLGRTGMPLRQRMYGHVHAAKTGRSVVPFHRALRTIGIGMFRITVLCQCTDTDEAIRTERRLIASLCPEYNCKNGGSGQRRRRGSPRRPNRLEDLPLPDLPDEVWKSINGYETMFEVSNMGRVRGIQRTTKTTEYGPTICRARLLKGTPDRKGHIRICFGNGPSKKSFFVHRLVAEAFIGPRPRGLNVLHKNDIANDNRAENLYYGTQFQNMQDRERNGKTARGERCGCAKLTAEMVREIRLLKPTTTYYALAARFGVSHTSIEQVVKGKTWTHVV